MVTRYADVSALRRLRLGTDPPLSMEQLAARADPPLAVRTIWSAEHRGRTTPATAARLARALGVTVADLAREVRS